MNTAWCSNCGDEFAPIEGNIPSIDEPNFCSDECRDEFTEAELNASAYDEGRNSAAPVW